MKKMLAALLPIVMIISFAGCGSGESQSDANKVSAPESSSYFKKKNFKTVVDRFNNSGFTNIKTEKIEDLITGWITKDGSVESVAIGGNDDFSGGDNFDSGTEVVVRYHTFIPTEDGSTDSASPDSSESNNSSSATSEDSLTPENNADLASLLNASNPDAAVIKTFYENYRGRTIEFDGFVGASMLHSSYKTRYDLLIDAGDFNPDKSQGPDFRLVSIGTESISGGSSPAVFPAGTNIHVKAEVGDYDDDPACIFLVNSTLSER